MSLNGVKSALKSLAYFSGMLGWWHRRRNARALTVFMFHRVLPRESAAYAAAEKEFTFSVEGFGRCLDFIRRHYSLVSAAEVEMAVAGNITLPPCPALITFDDGWRDTLVYACPQLKARNMHALLFLATEILESPSPQWWQDMLVRILEQPVQARQLMQRLGLPADLANARSREIDHAVAGAVAAMPLAERLALLEEFLSPAEAEAQMLIAEEVQAADRACIEFGAHGHTHAPLTMLARPELELQQSHALLASLQPGVSSMSFPHGAYTEAIMTHAATAGFRLTFTSDPLLLDLKHPGSGHGIGRIHIPENEWTTESGRVSFPKLATFLFFRPQASH
ncbi:MAG: polysaccharide deacetylase family protein [Rhodocyclaceae bacterium]|nr:polysaccharide deacetylase family protein [Rhodocyclaceae bacterium]